MTATRAIRTVGRYAIYDAIAQGGMATVHLGRLRGAAGFARIVAVKRLHPQLAEDPELVRSFTDEARLTARVAHPNVVPVLDVVALSGELFLVMDYVHGETLARLIVSARRAGTRVPPAIASAILCGVLHGLHAAHEALSAQGDPLSIVHRDVSPQNILVGVDGSARVLDFGIAKAAGKLSRTEAGVVKGKFGYMSPEQLYGERLDRRTDTYAAGVVLWETLVCDRLFAGDGDEPAIAKMMASAVEPPSRRVPFLPAAIDELVSRAVSRDRERRFATALEMALALERALPPATAPEVSAWVRLRAGEAISARGRLIAELEKEADENDRQSDNFSGITAERPIATDVSPVAGPIEAASTRTSQTIVAPAPTPAPAPAAPARRTIIPIAMTVGAGLFLGGALAARALIWGPTAAPSAEPAPSLSAAPPSSALASPPDRKGAEEAAGAENAAVADKEPAAAPARALTSSSSAPSSKAAKAAPKPIKTPPTNCNPPYTIDANGHKRYKRECLR